MSLNSIRHILWPGNMPHLQNLYQCFFSSSLKHSNNLIGNSKQWLFLVSLLSGNHWHFCNKQLINVKAIICKPFAASVTLHSVPCIGLHPFHKQKIPEQWLYTDLYCFTKAMSEFWFTPICIFYCWSVLPFNSLGTQQQVLYNKQTFLHFEKNREKNS